MCRVARESSQRSCLSGLDVIDDDVRTSVAEAAVVQQLEQHLAEAAALRSCERSSPEMGGRSVKTTRDAVNAD